jgi:hypothetical protein
MPTVQPLHKLPQQNILAANAKAGAHVRQVLELLLLCGASCLTAAPHYIIWHTYLLQLSLQSPDRCRVTKHKAHSSQSIPTCRIFEFNCCWLT